jgi:peptidoglycan hydrolase-like protein with peptidoglycan-binding domain
MTLKRIATALLLTGSALGLAACNNMGYDQPPAAQASRAQTQADRQAIAHVQSELQTLGYNVGPVDGVWGSESRAAMASFQQTKGLPASGQPDQASLNALAVAAASGTAPAVTAAAPPPALMQLPSIAQVQTELGQLGYYHGRVDGVWGRQTRTAMARFQRSQGLRPTGQGDVRSMNALAAAMQASGAPGYTPSAAGTVYR